MVRVGAALVPGIVASTWLFGLGVLVNVAVATAAGVLLEAAWLRIRHQPYTQLSDGSTIVTCLLLALALPPAANVAIVIIGVAIAVLIAKHLYGGLSNNLFNPAMVGYAAILLALPQALSAWDGLSGATALDAFAHRGATTVADVWQTDAFGWVGASGFEIVNAAFLIGGGYLCAVKIARWSIALAVLAGIGVCAMIGYDDGSSASFGSPMFHWFSGGTMLCAFFIATDPVTAPLAARGQWIFGIFIGAVIFLIRSFGAYPDGIAFAVLLGNLIVPLLDKLELAPR